MKRSQAIDRQKLNRIRIEAVNGKLTIGPSHDDQLHWTCRAPAQQGDEVIKIREEGATLVLPLTVTGLSKCTVMVPPSLDIRMEGSNGKVVIQRPQNNFDVNLANGKVILQPAPNRAYRFELRAANGSIDRFESSTAADALRISISVGNGKIVRDSI